MHGRACSALAGAQEKGMLETRVQRPAEEIEVQPACRAGGVQRCRGRWRRGRAGPPNVRGWRGS